MQKETIDFSILSENMCRAIFSRVTRDECKLPTTLLVWYFLSLLVTQVNPQSKLVNITRKPLFTDVINLPTSMCPNNNCFCGQMNAISGSQPTHCFCYCPYHKSTFYERHWKCVDDQEIRKEEGTVK